VNFGCNALPRVRSQLVIDRAWNIVLVLAVSSSFTGMDDNTPTDYAPTAAEHNTQRNWKFHTSVVLRNCCVAVVLDFEKRNF